MNQFRLDKRMVAGILLVIALFTMFFDCVSFSGSDDASQLMRYSFGISSSMLGNAKESKAANAIAGMYESGGLSIYEIRGMFSNMNKLDRDEGYMIVSVIFGILILVTLFAGGYALYGVYLRRKARGFWFASMLLVLIMGEGIIALAMGSGYYIDAFLTLWPFIGLGCAIASIVLCFKAAKQTVAPTSTAPAGAPAASAANAGAAGQALATELAKVLNIGKALGKQVGQKVGQVASNAASAAANAAASANTWTCPQCGKQVDGGSRFCSACGSPRPEKRFCPKCGAECKDGAAFCSKCGNRLGDMGGQPVQPAFNPAAAQTNYAPAQNAYAPAQSAPVAPQNSYAPAQSAPVIPQNQSTSTTMRVPVNNMTQPLCLNFEVSQDHTGFRQTYRLNIISSLTVGRHPDNDLPIDDNVVSGHHLRIDRNGDEMTVTDLNTTNGTILNGVPVQGTLPLNNGDELQVGFTRVKVEW